MAIFNAVPRAATTAEEAVALAKGLTGGGAKAAEGAAARGLSMLGKTYQQEIASLAEMLAHPSALKDPAGAAKIWDKIYQEIAQNAKLAGNPIGPGAGKITYKMPDGSMRVLPITERPPLGAERISMTDAELRELMPPRPKPPAEANPKPANAYETPRPAEPAAAPTAAPATASPAASAAQTQSAEAVELAKELAGGSRPPRGPWTKPQSVPSISAPQPAPFVAKEPSNFLVYGGPAAIGAGAVGAGASALEGAATGRPTLIRDIINSYTGGPDPYMTKREDDPNLGNMPYLGSGVSADASDFVSDNLPARHRESAVSYDNSDFFQHPDPNRWNSPLADRLPGSPTVQQAVNVAKKTVAPAPAGGQHQTANTQGQATAPATASSAPSGSDGLVSFLRGRFGEAATRSPMEDRLTAAQEERDRMGNARGGTVDGKQNKEAVLHKALEIIHHLISKR